MSGSRTSREPSPEGRWRRADQLASEIKEWAGREAQTRVIQELQKRTNISRQELARLLGVDPKTLRSRLKEMSTS